MFKWESAAFYGTQVDICGTFKAYSMHHKRRRTIKFWLTVYYCMPTSIDEGSQLVKGCQTIQLPVCFYHVTYAFQSESTLYSCLNVKELLARKRGKI